jgi:hypothetical protein
MIFWRILRRGHCTLCILLYQLQPPIRQLYQWTLYQLPNPHLRGICHRQCYRHPTKVRLCNFLIYIPTLCPTWTYINRQNMTRTKENCHTRHLTTIEQTQSPKHTLRMPPLHCHMPREPDLVVASCVLYLKDRPWIHCVPPHPVASGIMLRLPPSQRGNKIWHHLAIALTIILRELMTCKTATTTMVMRMSSPNYTRSQLCMHNHPKLCY